MTHIKAIKTFAYITILKFLIYRDNWGRKWSYLVAIDAICYRDRFEQYNMKAVKRELIKAFAGFHTRGRSTSHAFPVATGNWGCGAFNGDRQLKGILIRTRFYLGI